MMSHSPQELDLELSQRTAPGENMGEVRVTVKLTNPMDQAMAREGFKGPEDIRRMEVEALVDTGAVNCVLPPRIADALGLARAFKQTAQYADGREEVVDVTEPVLFEILGRMVYEECLVLGDEALIGQTALESTDLFVDCRSGKLIPNPAHPDQPVIMIRGVGRIEDEQNEHS